MKKVLLSIFALVLCSSIYAQTITVVSPNGGETWSGCSIQNITWSHSGTSGYFNVEYSTNGGSTWASLANNYSGTSLSWTVPNVSTSQALIKVYDYNNSTISDMSNANFTIIAALIVTQPNGSENWQGGSSQTITWSQGTGASNYWTIRYSTDAGSSWTTIINNANITNGQYVWNPLPNTPSASCLIQVYDYQNSSCRTDNSDNLFTITPATPVITIGSPNGGNTFYVGTAYTITWSSAYLTSSFVKLEYSIDNGATWLLIANSTNNDNSESWTVPNAPSSQCLVRVSEYGNPSVYDVSNAVFSIVYPYVVVTSPNGGESWNGCSTQTISWTGYGTGSGPWKVEYSSDNGTSWNTLTNSTSSSTYSWNPVPNNPTSLYLVKVTRTTDALVTDMSSANFTVTLNTAIVVNTPNGGENWQVGGPNQLISWAWAGTSNYYNIYYSVNNGTNWSAIVINQYITNGQYSWTIPNDPSTQVLIKVEDYNNTCKFDVSDAVFTIAPPTPTITVNSPNGGNNYYVGTAFNITWTSAYLTSSFVQIEYSTNNGTNWTTIFASTNNDGSESWTVPNTPSTNCLVRVSEYGNPTVNDVSNAVFNIIYPYVLVTSPNGGESWNGCSSQSITWTGYGAGTGPWRVEYSINNGSSWSILTSSTTSSSYTWNPVPNSPSTQSLVRVTKTTDALVTDVSNTNFIITQNTAIVITSPNGGENWQVANPSSRTITWTATGTSNYYNLYYSIDNGTNWLTIATNQYITNGQYNWTIPNNPSVQVLVYVEDYYNSCKFDISDAIFTILPPTPVITVSAPNGGNTYYVGTAYNINWSSAYVTSPYVKIEYSTDNGATWNTIFNSTNNDNSESWTVPNTPSSQCLVRVSEYGNPSVYDISNAVFSIVYPYVVVTSPNGGESWAGCSSQTITWSGYGAGTGPWKVEYSLNNGSSWTTLTNSTTSNSFTWNPLINTPSTQCIFRVTRTTDALVTDMSNATFTITLNQAIVINTPNGGESWQVGGPSQLITWAWSGTSNYYNIYYSVNNGSTWNTIVTNQYITNGQYSWTIPNNPSSQVLIMVEDYNNTCKYDISDNVFTITSPTPVITVNSPNGGNNYYVGTAYNITWSSAYLTSSFVQIEYSTNNGSTWSTIFASTSNDGSESWTVPNTPSTNCLVRISEYGNPSVNDVSNAVFNIIYPYVLVTSPNGGESWNGCSSQTISWNGYGAGTGPWKVEYSINNGSTWNILTSSTTSSSITWNPVPNSPNTQSLIRVTKTTDAMVTDMSNAAFTITQNTAIVVTAPNGSENWQVANPSTRTITWTATGTSNYYNIYYSIDNGANWITIVTNQYITNGQYNWTIPNNPSTMVLVKVEDYNNTCKFDISDAVFIIQPPTPVITVSTPNGGNTYYVGTSYNITWSSQYLTSSFVKLEYSTDNGITWFVIVTATNNDNSESWLAPNTPSTNCLVRVSEYGNPGVNDVSNTTFSIVTPYIMVTYPDGGENWNGCSTQSITWSGYGTGSGPYMVEYSMDNGFSWTTLISSTTSTSYSWNPVPNISASQALVRVSLASNTAVNDVGNSNFNIIQQPYIIINSPNGGENWQVNNPATRTITWASANVSNYYNIYYSVNGGNTWNTIVSYQYISNNQYVWTVPNNPSTNVLIKIEDYNNTCKFDVSDAPFTITAPTPYITVSYPNGGQTLYAFNSANITWSSAYLTSSFVKIEYSVDNGSTWVVITSSTSNTGSYSWTIPNISTTTALIRITDVGNNVTYDNSDAVFTIKPGVTITAPNGGESLSGCTVTTISWQGEGSSVSYSLQYSLNGGSSWTSIVSQSFSGGPNYSYNWTLPNTPSNYCLVKVTNNSNTNKTDVSDAVFSITPTITVTNPNSGGSYAIGSSVNISWNSQGVSGFYNIDYSTNGGSSWNSIVFNQNITTNSYSWTVPNVPSSNCYIRVTDYNNTCKQDLSDLAFTISASPAALTVTSPNGSENWTVCSERNITWSANGTSGAYTIEYSSNNGGSWNTLVSNYATTNCVYAWMVPSTSTTQGLIRVKDFANGAIIDQSNAVFTISALATTGTIAGNATVCEGSLQTYSVALVSGATSYTWTIPAGWTGTSTSNTINVIAGSSNGNISVVANNGCSSSSESVKAVTVTLLPATPGVISGNTAPCSGVSQTYSIGSVNGATSYSWLLPAGYSGASTTNSINTIIGYNSGNIQVYAQNSCGSGGVSALTIYPNGNSLPLQPGNISGAASPCTGTSQTYTIIPVAGATSYAWTLPSGWSGSSTTNTINVTTGSTGGTISVTAINTCGSSTAQTLTVSVSTVPAQPGTISGNTSICANSSNIYSISTVSGAINYTWTPPTGWTGLSSFTSINTIAAGSSGNIHVTANNACGSSAPRTLAITVNSPVVPSVSVVRSPTGPICGNVSVTFTATPINGGTPAYQWIKNNIAVGTNSPVYTASSWNVNDSVWVVMTSNLSCITATQVTSNRIGLDVTPVVTPTITISTTSNTICSGQSVTFNAAITNGGSSPAYQWRKNGSNISGATSSTYTTNSIVNGEIYTCVLISNAGCASPVNITSNSITMSVSNNLASSIFISATPGGAICAGTSVTFTSNPTNGGSSPVYDWKVNGISVGSGSSYVSSSLSNNDSVRCNMTSSLTCVSPATAVSNKITMNMGQNQEAVVTITTNNNPICTGQTVTFSATPLYGGASPSYQWRKNGNTINGATLSTYSTASIIEGDIFDVVMTSNYNCLSKNKDTSNAIVMQVSSSVTPSVVITVLPENTICSGITAAFTATPLNGGAIPTYQWKKNGSDIVGATSSTYSSSSLLNGDYISVFMTSSASCASPITATSNTISMTVVANTTASVNISGNPTSPVCNGDNVLFTASPINGGSTPVYQWKLNGATVSGANSSTYSSASLVSGDQVSLQMITSKLCATPSSVNSNTLTYAVNAIPLTPGIISGNTNTCEGVLNTYSITPVSGATSYTWNLPSGWTGSSTSSSINATAGAVSGNITVTANNSCGNSSAQTLSITVSPLPTQPDAITGNTSICSGTSNTYSIFPVNYATSYTWTLPGGWSGTSPSTSISPTAGTSGGNITVKANNGCGSSAVTSLAVTVNSVPATPGIISGNTSICPGSSNTYYISAVNGATLYTWTLPSGWAGTPSTNSINTSSNNTGGTISVSASNGCGTSGQQTLAITVNNIPSTPTAIIGNTTSCQSSVNSYSVTPVSGATSYTWTLPSGWSGSSTTNTINATAGAASGDITVTANNACGSSLPQVLAVSVNPVPAQPTAISGNTVICSGTSNTYSISAVNFATSYTWTLPGGWTGTSTSETINTTASTASGNITVKANNGCGSSPVQTLAVTVNSIPATPGAIAGNASICAGSANTYSITPVSGATSYTWTLPGGWSGSSTTSSISTTANATGGNITVTAGNACGTSAAQTLLVTVNTSPFTPGIISGNSDVCQNTINTYSITPVNGATSYNWTLPSGWSGSSTSSSINATAGSVSGNITVTAQNSCGVSTQQILAVNVSTIPSQPGIISGNTTICSGTSNSYSIIPVAGATSYTWNLPFSWTGSSTTESITSTASTTSGNITVTANNSCGTSAFQMLEITVNSIPTTPGIITGNATICSGSSNIYSITPVNGATSYTWALPSGWSGTSTTSSITTTANTSGGSISVSANNICGISSAQTLSVNVNNIPAAAGVISGNTNPCTGVAETYSILPVAGASTYTWVLPAGYIGTSTTNTIDVVIGSTPGNVQVYANNSCGSGSTNTLLVSPNGNSLPEQPGIISGSPSPCTGSTETYNIAPVSGAISYTWMLPNGWSGTSNIESIDVVVGNTSGSISITANNACGTSASQSLSVTVVPIPASAGIISGSTSACQGENAVSYTVAEIAGAIDYVWQLPVGASGSSNTNNIMVSFEASASSGSISVYGHNSCGDGATSTLAVEVYPVPATPVISMNGNILHSDAPFGNQWYNQNGIINGATGQDYTPVEEGDYYVIVSMNGCASGQSNTINILFTGIEANDYNTTLTLYPNPATDVLTIEIEGNRKNIRYDIYNELGQVLLSGIIIDKTIIKTTDYARGIYVIKFDDGIKPEYRKFIKN